MEIGGRRGFQHLLPVETRGPLATSLTGETLPNSLITYAQSYDYTTTWIKKKTFYLHFENREYLLILSPLHAPMQCAKVGYNLPSGSGEEGF